MFIVSEANKKKPLLRLLSKRLKGKNGKKLIYVLIDKYMHAIYSYY